MKRDVHAPGAVFWLMGLLSLGAFLASIGTLLGVVALPGDNGLGSVALAAIVSLGMTGMLALGWHRFEVRAEGLHVVDLRGRRLHPWPTLGRVAAHDFGSGRKGSVLMDTAHRGGASDPAAYSHRLLDSQGRMLYRIGPWYPTRRALLREVLRRTREAA